MTVIKSISFDDLIFERYLDGYKGDNFSSYIQKLVVLGYESLTGKTERYAIENNGLRVEVIELQKQLLEMQKKIQEMKTNKVIISNNQKSEEQYERIIEKYQLMDSDLNLVKEFKPIIEKNPAFLNGNVKRFRAETGKQITKTEFSVLINNL